MTAGERMSQIGSTTDGLPQCLVLDRSELRGPTLPAVDGWLHEYLRTYQHCPIGESAIFDCLIGLLRRSDVVSSEVARLNREQRYPPFHHALAKWRTAPIPALSL